MDKFQFTAAVTAAAAATAAATFVNKFQLLIRCIYIHNILIEVILVKKTCFGGFR
jgi:hypothetical protein